MRFRRAAALVLALFAMLGAGRPGPSAAAGAGCTSAPVATLPLELRGGHYVTRVRIAGQEQVMAIDTGAAASTLDSAVAKRLGLPVARGVAGIVGAGGSRKAGRLTARSFALGALELGPVTLLAGAPGAGGAVGLLGADLLSRFDVAFDPGQEQLTLHAVRDCADRFLDWSEPYGALRLTPFVDRTLKRVPVVVDGVTLQALVDTGASQTVLFRRAAARLAFRPSPGDRRGFGLGAAGRRVATVLHRFGRLTLGDETLDGPELAVADDDPLGLDMILGLDVLGGRRVWLSYATSQMFIAPR